MHIPVLKCKIRSFAKPVAALILRDELLGALQPLGSFIFLSLGGGRNGPVRPSSPPDRLLRTFILLPGYQIILPLLPQRHVRGVVIHSIPSNVYPIRICLYYFQIVLVTVHFVNIAS